MTDRKKFPIFPVLLIGLLLFYAPGNLAFAGTRPYLEAAKKAAAWIESSAKRSESGTFWPVVPGKTAPVTNNLYSGNAGVVLFFLEVYHTTGDSQYLKAARCGADHLLAGLAKEKNMGLYTGAAGIGFALEETYKTTKEKKYRQGVLRCLKTIRQQAVTKGKGVEWSGVTDIISGNAGTGLFLIFMAKELKDRGILELAARAGVRLIELGIPVAIGKAHAGSNHAALGEKNKKESNKQLHNRVDKGMKWAMHPDYPQNMPNFAHGTAGIAYFLATLYKETKRKEFLQAALAGAAYLLSIARTAGDVCLVHHHEPGGEELYYLGWCHGPTGTARLFYRLYEVTGDKAWLDWVKKSAKGIMESGIPEKQHPGFWNNVGLCCGTAGVADFFLHLYTLTRDRIYLDFTKKLTASLLSKAVPEGEGIKWIQAEHRRRPDFLEAQTGLMQGAAGIGIWLLRLDAFEREKKIRIRLPDDPF